MIFRKAWLGILLAANLSGACNHQIVPSKQKVNYISRFENNNVSLDDKVATEVAQSVELVESYARYKLEWGGEVFEDKVGKRGSGTVLAEVDGKYYVLTAHHLVEMPSVASSSVSFSQYDKNLKNLLDLDLPKPLKNTATSSATITLIGTPTLAVNGITGGEVVCFNRDLDYALITVPSNGQLQPLTKTKHAAIGDSDIITAADYTYTIGYSLALGRFISVGNVSNNNLPLGSGGGIGIQRTDAFMFTSPISPGNSGGPVFTVAKNKMYLSGVVVAYLVNGQNLNVAIKIKDILQNITQQGCLSSKIINQQYPSEDHTSKK